MASAHTVCHVISLDSRLPTIKPGLVQPVSRSLDLSPSTLSAGASLRQSAVTSVSWCITPSVCCHFCQLVHHSVSLLSLLSVGASLRQSAVTSVNWCITPSVCCHFCQLVHHSVSLLSLLSAGASLRQSAVTSVSWCITPSVCCHSATSLSDSFCHVTSVDIVRSKVISTQ